MAKAAGEGASSPALTASSSKSVEEDGQREQQGAEKVEEKKQLNKKELEVTVSAAVPIKQVQETLSVTTELGNRGEEPLYEPVSPTPLPDSPCNEAKPAAVVEEKAVDCNPFAEVINKKDGVSRNGGEVEWQLGVKQKPLFLTSLSNFA